MSTAPDSANNETTEAIINDLNTTDDKDSKYNVSKDTVEESPQNVVVAPPHIGTVQKNLLLCRRFKDSTGSFRNFNSLPLFVYATSPSTHAKYQISADGVGVIKEAVAAAAAVAAANEASAGVLEKHDICDLAGCCRTTTIQNRNHLNDNKSGGIVDVVINAMECLPLNGSNNNSNNVSSATGTTIHGGSSATYQHQHHNHHLNLNQNHQLLQLSHAQHNHHHLLMSHQSGTSTATTTLTTIPYSNNCYPLQHSSSHHNIHSEQTKSLQELQHEVGALLEFRDLVIETFPDLKHKMASMSSSSTTTTVSGNSSTSTAAVGGVNLLMNGTNGNGKIINSGTNTLTGSVGGMSSSSLASRREWEPGIRVKRKTSQKESSSSTNVTSNAAVASAVTVTANGAGDLSSSSLTRSRSNSHSGKKEPKSAGENNGSVVQDSGFSTETSSSKEGHSASSTNGAMTGPNATTRLSCLESDDELLNLLDVIHRKSNRLREEVELLQNYERTQLNVGSDIELTTNDHQQQINTTQIIAATAVTKSNSGNGGLVGLTPKTFREHVERINKEDIKQLRKERDRLLDKLAEMEAETLTGRIKAAKMNDQVEELINVKKDLEEQLKLAMAQKLELSSRVQQLQQQQQSKSSSSSQSDYSSQRNFSSSATTVLSTLGASQFDSGLQQQQQNLVPSQQQQLQRRQNTFQPVVVVSTTTHDDTTTKDQNAFHQSALGSDINKQLEQQSSSSSTLGRLDGIVSTPGARNTKCRLPDSKRFAAILLETSVIELQRHLLTLTVQNQVLMQKLEQSTKSKTHLAKRLDKSKEDVEDLRFQLEEKNIELEGTKAQLRVLESRLHSPTPNPTTIHSTSSYLLHSQNDYETNRSSASTTLMLSRRGINGINDSSDLRSATPSTVAMPPPTTTQISTPSMKAMTHLPMDDLQQHSSSTESAHDHDLVSGSDEQRSNGSGSRLIMSTSVGGLSNGSFEKRGSGGDPLTRRYLTATKPSKIPLPGSKSVSYFGGKPPTGRPSTAGRSPNQSSSNMSAASSKSSLSRSTGNLLYSKSPNSLKRADSTQSIRNALNTSTTSSNLSTSGNVTNPSTTTTTRVLQNSPLPRPKRDSITARLRNIESVSRSHHNNEHNNSTTSSTTTTSSNTSIKNHTTPNTTPRTSVGAAKTPNHNNNNNSNYYLVSSTPKPSTIAAQLNSTLRKDLQLNAGGSSSQQFPRRAIGTTTAPTTTQNNTKTSTFTSNANATSVTRRFSSASTLAGIRSSARNHHQDSTNSASATTPTTTSTTATAHHHDHLNSNGGNSDSDSGKKNLAVK